jgi:hypothetical protein
MLQRQLSGTSTKPKRIGTMSQTNKNEGIHEAEGVFARLIKRRLKRGAFHSLGALQAAINCFLVEVNENPKPFRWAKDPDKIIAAVRRGHQALVSIQ